MSTKQKLMDFLDKQGFYIVLAICLIVIAATAIFTVTRSGKQNDNATTETQSGVEANYAGENMLLENAQKSTMETIESTKKKVDKLKIGRPVEGEVINSFAKDKLIYNETLKQWTTHEGIDIGCVENAKVKAVLGGTVEDVKEDALMGQTIIIKHDNGHKSIYCNLDKEQILVKKDDKIKQGQDIASVGKTAICEFQMEPHLHFEYWIEEKPVDPMEYIEGLKVRDNKSE